jgi:molecular chaperone Hsp33
MAYKDHYLAGALMLQKMPEKSDLEKLDNVYLETAHEDWITDIALISTVTKKELLDGKLTSKDLLYKLLHERDVMVLDAKNLTFKCRCSQSKIEAIIKNFDQNDLKEMIVDGKVSILCEFCNHEYFLKTPTI